MKSFHMYTIAGLCIYIYIYAVYIMIQCTEPATPDVIVCSELPVSLQEAVLGLKTRSLITVLSERGEGFFRQLLVEPFPHFEKEQIKRRMTGASNIQADADRCKQRQTVSLVDVTHSLDNNISPPKFNWSAQPKCWPRPID